MQPSSQIFQELSSFKRRPTQEILGEAETRYDIPGITSRLSNYRRLVNNLSRSVEAVDPSVTGRTSGSFVTEAQRAALVNKERRPLLEDLSKQQQALGETQGEYSLASGLASNLVSALQSEDESRYQKVLDRYNAARAAEQAAEDKRQFEENLRLEQYKARTGGGNEGGGIDLSGIIDRYLASQGQNNQGSLSPEEIAYTSVQKFLRGTDASIRSDYNATKKSADRGNPADKIKIQLYERERPDLFKKAPAKKSAPAKGPSAPKSPQNPRGYDFGRAVFSGL